MVSLDLTMWGSADLVMLEEASAPVDRLPEIAHGRILVDEAEGLYRMQWRC